MRENELLAQLPELFRTDDPTVLVGSGPDDCAHVVSPDPRLALSTDAIVEGVHFLSTDTPEDVADKAVRTAVSDLAASAARPLWALVSLCLKKKSAPDWADRFAAALAATARAVGITVVGGDVTSSPEATMVSVTVIGTPLPGGPLLRSGAQPDDVIAVTGTLGGSILGRHLHPTPRTAEIAALMRFCTPPVAPPTACMDISDGLALDLSRLCRESGVGAVVQADMIPVSDAARERSRTTGKTPLAHALSDGEDFELLLTMPPATWQAFETGGQAELFTRIGCITKEKELRITDAHGEALPLIPEGYQHQW